MDRSSFEAYIKNSMDSWHCPGVAIAIIKEDKVLYQGAFGFRDAEKRLPLTEETRFPLASVTKSLTAMSAALLVDDGLLEWDKPVCHYIPEFILDDPYITRHVTVRDMLSHRTGLPRHDFAAWRLDIPRSEFIKRMRHLKFSATFREKFQYNNLMYAATGYLVEKIANQRWEDFAHERIFTPLGMTASNFAPTFSDGDYLLAEGYRVKRDEEGKYKQLIRMPFGEHTELSPGPAGALFSTLSDLTRWMNVHVNGGKCGDVQLVSPENLQQMHSPHMVIPATPISYSLSGMTMLAYGMGWMIRPYPYADGTLIFHGGNVEGHSLVIGFTPESKLGVVVLTNAANCELSTILLRDALDRVLELPSKDWNKKFHAMLDPHLAAAGKGEKTSKEDRLKDTSTSQALEAYEGTYSADGYPDFDVKLEDGQLYARTIGSLDWSELHHYHYDVFEWTILNWDVRIKANFSINAVGEVGAVSIPIEPQVEDIVFVRKPIVVEAVTLSAISGEYYSEIEGMTFSVIHKNGKTHWQESGQPAVEALPCAVREFEVEFKVGRARVLFYQTEGKFSRLILKVQGATFDAYKR